MKALGWTVGIGVLGACLFFVSGLRFIRTIDIRSRGETVAVSVGYERTDFANTEFPGSSDWEILRARGPIEEEIWRIWTPKSIILARLVLFLSYLLFLLSAIAACSLAALFEGLGRAPNP